LKAAILFSLLVFASSLLSPTVAPDDHRTVYQVMFDSSGIRYWLIPMVCLLTVFLWGAYQKQLIIKKISQVFLLILVFFTCKHLIQFSRMRYNPYADYHWGKNVTEFEKLPPGESKTFIIHPGWEMTLVRK
jgi:hypothetical protein